MSCCCRHLLALAVLRSAVALNRLCVELVWECNLCCTKAFIQITYLGTILVFCSTLYSLYSPTNSLCWWLEFKHEIPYLRLNRIIIRLVFHYKACVTLDALSALATQVFLHVTLMRLFCERQLSFGFHENVMYEVDWIFLDLFHATITGEQWRRKMIKSTDKPSKQTIQTNHPNWNSITSFYTETVFLYQSIMTVFSSCFSLFVNSITTYPPLFHFQDQSISWEGWWNYTKTQRQRERERGKTAKTGGLKASHIFSPSVSYYLSTRHCSLFSYWFCAACFQPPCHGISCLLSS